MTMNMYLLKRYEKLLCMYVHIMSTIKSVYIFFFNLEHLEILVWSLQENFIDLYEH